MLAIVLTKMVTCAEQYCRVRTNLDEQGYCTKHVKDDSTDDCKCGKCQKPMESDAKALMCEAENCKSWFHLQCTNVTESLYEIINECSKADEDVGIRWLCLKCRSSEHTIKVVPKNSDVDRDNICNKLRHGKCPHGISGKTEYKGKSCEFVHPKVCKRYVRNGSAGRYGCKLSEKQCKYFHPILCKNSVKSRKCLDKNCSYTHLRGTARREVVVQPSSPESWQTNRHVQRDPNYPNQQSSVWAQYGPSRFSNSTSGYKRQHAAVQTSANTNFLDPKLASPMPHLSLLQAQVNRLEELIVGALKAPQTTSKGAYFNPLDGSWPGINQSFQPSQQPQTAYHQK